MNNDSNWRYDCNSLRYRISNAQELSEAVQEGTKQPLLDTNLEMLLKNMFTIHSFLESCEMISCIKVV